MASRSPLLHASQNRRTNSRGVSLIRGTLLPCSSRLPLGGSRLLLLGRRLGLPGRCLLLDRRLLPGRGRLLLHGGCLLPRCRSPLGGHRMLPDAVGQLLVVRHRRRFKHGGVPFACIRERGGSAGRSLGAYSGQRGREVAMTRKTIDCRDFPSETGCTLTMSGTESE